MEIKKIAVTGGPCAGKSTAMARIKEELEGAGYTVLLVHETATELITGGVAPWTCGTSGEYQKYQMLLQIEKEQVFEAAALTMDAQKILIVCDRGAMDSRAYMSEEEFLRALDFLKTDEVALRDSYDAVFHLATAAKSAGELYTTDNNSARKESADEAVHLDDLLICAWTGHPHFRMIESSYDFNEKIKRLISEIKAFLGIPEPLEIERKFLIKYPDTAALDAMPSCKRIDIEQIYIGMPNGENARLRKRGADGRYIYFLTKKRDVTPTKRIEIEKRLDAEEYNYLLSSAVSARKINKTRYCLSFESRYFEIDVFPFWSDKALLELELLSEDEAFELPPFFEVIKEVTEDSSYKNSVIAKLYGECVEKS